MTGAREVRSRPGLVADLRARPVLLLMASSSRPGSGYELAGGLCVTRRRLVGTAGLQAVGGGCSGISNHPSRERCCCTLRVAYDSLVAQRYSPSANRPRLPTNQARWQVDRELHEIRLSDCLQSAFPQTGPALTCPLKRRHAVEGLAGSKFDAMRRRRIGSLSMNQKIDSEEIHAASNGRSDLHVVAKLCSAGGCPTIYRTSTGDLLVQGYTVDGDAPALPEGEGLVRIPAALLAEAARSMS